MVTCYSHATHKPGDLHVHVAAPLGYSSNTSVGDCDAISGGPLE